jgi:hypothetical protein
MRAAAIPPTVAHSLSEASFQEQVIDLAEQYGWRVAHFHDSRRQVRPGVHVGDKRAAGWPDLTLCRPPEFLVVELKAETGRLTDAQRSWLQALEMSGVEIHVWKPSQWPEIQERLAR